MLPVLESILPIFVLIALGTLLRRAGLVAEQGWRGLDQLGFFVLYPALLFVSIIRADFSGLALDALIGSILFAVVLTGCAVYLAAPVLIRSGLVTHRQYSSVFQTTVRWNGFIALAVAERMMPPEALAVIALVMAAIVLPVNVAAVYVVSRYADAVADLFLIMKRTLTNPIVLGCLAALAWRMTGLAMPTALNGALDLIARAALGMGLLGIGAGLKLADLARPGFAVLLPSVTKLVLFPLLVIGLSIAFGVPDSLLPTMALCAAVPTAMNGYVVARQLGGDAELYAAIVTLQTLAAFFTMPMMIGFASSLAS